MGENAAKNKSGDLVITIPAESIRGTEILKSGDYKYARVGSKIDDDTYVSVSYEWKGSGVPDAVMALMEYMKANKEDIKENKEEVAALQKRLAEVK